MDGAKDSYVDQAQVLFSGYLKSLNKQYMLENVASFAGDNLAQVGYIALFNVPGMAARPLYHSIKFGFSWLGKQCICALNPPTQTGIEKQSIKFEFSEIEDDFLLVESLPQSSSSNHPSGVTYQFSDDCKKYMLTLKPIDLISMTGGLVGAGAASYTFALFVGPPSLIGVPVLLVTEAMAQGFGEYLGKISAKKLLGEEAQTPLSKQLLPQELLGYQPQFKTSTETNSETSIQTPSSLMQMQPDYFSAYKPKK